jgi:hypothetical protein
MKAIVNGTAEMSAMKGILRALFCVLALTSAARAQGEEKTVTGEVVALSCYVREGDAARTDIRCSQSELSAGNPAVIIEKDTGTAYLAVSKDNTSNAARRLYLHVNKCALFSGTVGERGGVKVLALGEIKELAPAAEPGQAPGTANTSSGS